MNPKIMIAGGAVLLVGASVGISMLLMPKPAPVDPEMAAAMAEEAAPAETYYFTFQPEFIVNFNSESKTKYLMLDLAVSSLNEAVPDLLKKHTPEIRNDLLILFGESATEDLYTPEGKNALREQVAAKVAEIVDKHLPKGEIEDVFFTRFVME